MSGDLDEFFEAVDQGDRQREASKAKRRRWKTIVERSERSAAPARNKVSYLLTEHLILRPLLELDAEGLHACYSDPRAMRWFDLPPTRSVAEAGLWIRHYLSL